VSRDLKGDNIMMSKTFLARFEAMMAKFNVTYNNIGSVCQAQEKYDEALEYYQKDLKIRLMVYGQDHALVAESYHKIGTVYDSQVKQEEALEFYQKSLEIRIRLQVEDGPNP